MSQQLKSGSNIRKKRQRRKNEAKGGKKTLFELGWTSKLRAIDATNSTKSHFQDNVQSGSIIPLPSSQTSPDAREINTGLGHNVEEASTDANEANQGRNQTKAENREIGTITVRTYSEETINEDERLFLNVDHSSPTNNKH